MSIQTKYLVRKQRVRQATKNLFNKFTDDRRIVFPARAIQWPTNKVPDAMSLNHPLGDFIHASAKDRAMREYWKALKQLEQ